MIKKRKIVLPILACSLITVLGVSIGLFSQNPRQPVQAETIASEYFTSSETITVQTNVADTKGAKGISVTLDGLADKQKASFEYKNYIEVSTLDDGFLEMSLSPSGHGVVDKTDNDFVIVTLTDAVNEEEKLVYAVASNPPGTSGWWNKYVAAWISYTDNLQTGVNPSYLSAPIMKIAGTSQSIHGKNGFVNAAHKLYYGQYMDCGTLIGEKNNYFIQTSDTAQLKSLTFTLSNQLASINGTTIADLQNSDFLYYSSRYLMGTQYEGLYTKEYGKNLFSSGYCKLKIEYQDIHSDSVTCHIKSIGGQSFADNPNCAIKRTSPLIQADVCENAVIGYDYTVPSVSAYDMIDGDLSNTATAKILDASRRVVHSGFGKYRFTEAGAYSVEYKVTNLNGDTFTKSYMIDCYGEIPNTSFGFITDYQENYTVGETIILPSTLAKNAISIGGAIEADVLIQRNGRVIDSFSNAESRKYTLTQDGEYAVVFRYTNSYGVSDSEVKRFSVEKGILIHAKPPVSLTAGRMNTLCDFTIENHYNEVAGNEIYRAIFINGTNVYTAKGNTVINGSLVLAADTFTLKGTANVEYKVGFDGNTYDFSQSYIVPVIKPKYVGDYLIPYTEDGTYTDEKATIINQSSNTVFETTENGGFVLPREISEENLLLNFNIREGKSDFESLTIILENFSNRNQKLSFVLNAEDNVSSILTIQGATYKVSGSLINPQSKFDFVWGFECATLCDNLGVSLTDKVAYWDNGEMFQGFAEGIVLRFEFNGVGSNGAGVELETIGNQAFVSTVLSSGVQPLMDVFAPYIELNGSYTNVKTSFGETLTIHSAKAYDVLDSFVTLFVKVTAPDGTVILDNVSCEQEYTIVFDQLGTYTVAYTAYDSFDIVRQPKRFTFQVRDEQVPILTITNPPKDLYAVGQTIQFDGIYAFDNYTSNCEVYIYVVADDGERELVKDSYTFTKSGTYRIVYYTIDEELNYCIESYNVKVSGGVK